MGIKAIEGQGDLSSSPFNYGAYDARHRSEQEVKQRNEESTKNEKE